MTPEVTSLKMIKLVIFTVFANSVCILCTKSPVLIWSSSRPLSDLPQSYAGETLSGGRFNKAYLEPLTSNGDHSLVVFMQDMLSVEDFTNHADVYNPNSNGGAFKNVKSAMDDQFSVHLPAVSDTKASIESISSSFPGELVKVANPDDFGKLNLEDGKSYLIIVDLEPIQQQEEYGSFKRNDEAIGQCLRHLNKQGVKYSAIYTAESSSKVQEESRQGRHLLETTTAGETHNGTFVSYKGLMMFLNNISVTVTLQESDTAKAESLSATYLFENESQANITYDNETYSITLTFAQPGNGSAEIFMEIIPTNQFEFESRNGTFTWTPVNNDKYKLDAMPMDFKVQATLGFCYHCTILRAQPELRQINTTDIRTRHVSLVLYSFQIEALNPWNHMNNTLRFSDDVWDCVEFFTVPIWMGLFTTVVLMIILFFGVTMISRITTMDRFDDPKGKTITVTVNE